jgi:hypothetical protein
VAASSADIYRACGVLHRFEDGPPILCHSQRNLRSAPGLRPTHLRRLR